MTDLTKNSGPYFDSSGNLLTSGSVTTAPLTQSFAPLVNVSATGDSATFTWGGGSGLFTVIGTFGATVATLDYLGPNSQYVAAASLSAAGGIAFGPIPAGTTMKVNLTGGSPSGIYATVAS